MKRILLSLLIFLPGFFSVAQQLNVEVNGNVTFDPSVFAISEAGMDFASATETNATVLLSVLYGDSWDKKVNPNGKWHIKMYKVDHHWNESLLLESKRTGKGYKPGSPATPNIHDGETYQPVSQTPSYFFRGKGEIEAIPVRLKLDGLSVTLGADDFETTLVFTVYDDWN